MQLYGWRERIDVLFSVHITLSLYTLYIWHITGARETCTRAPSQQADQGKAITGMPCHRSSRTVAPSLVALLPQCSGQVWHDIQWSTISLHISHLELDTTTHVATYTHVHCWTNCCYHISLNVIGRQTTYDLVTSSCCSSSSADSDSES